MTFTFAITNNYGIITIHSGGIVSLSYYLQDNYNPIPSTMDITYTIQGNPNVVFASGQQVESHTFPHTQPVSTFGDSISLISTDGLTHLVAVNIVCIINNTQVGQAISVNIVVP